MLADGDVASERRPLLIVSALVMKALGHPSAVDLPLENLVTPSSLSRWNLDHVAKALEGTGIHTNVGRLDPHWCEVRMIPTKSDRPTAASDIQRRPRYSFYLQLLDDIGDWRVHVLAKPGLPVDTLR